MISPELHTELTENGYFLLKEIPGRGICGLKFMAFTVGLMVGLNMHSYYGRYCYKHLADAREALEAWDGVGDPINEWIKWKGEGGDRSRVPDPFDY